MENWKDIDEFEGFLISTKGRCYSQKTKRMLKAQKYSNGYLFYSFKIKGIQYTRSIHRLMAKAFIPNPENKPQVDHINGIRDDNRLENLRWATQTENNLNPITNAKHINGLKNSENAKKALKKATEVAAIKNRKKVYMYSLDGRLEATYNSVIDAGKENNCCPQNISACCRGRLKQVKGHKWSYEPL